MPCASSISHRGTQGPQFRQLVMLGPSSQPARSWIRTCGRGSSSRTRLTPYSPGDTVISGRTAYREKTRRACSASGAHVLDATCPKVKQAQLAIDEATRRGDFPLPVRRGRTPGSAGLVSYANGPCLVFGSLKELKEKQTFKDTHDVVLAAQTTQEREEFEAIKNCLRKGTPSPCSKPSATRRGSGSRKR